MVMDFQELPRSLNVLWIHGDYPRFLHGKQMVHLKMLRELVIGCKDVHVAEILALPPLLQDFSATNIWEEFFDWSRVSMSRRPYKYQLQEWVYEGWASLMMPWCDPRYLFDEASAEIVDHLYPRPDPSCLLPAFYADGRMRGFVRLAQNMKEAEWALPRLRQKETALGRLGAGNHVSAREMLSWP